jgi:hypothetical protein
VKQSAFTIVGSLDPDQGAAMAELEAFLNEIGDDIRGNPHLRFGELTGLHFASLCLVAQDGLGSFLLFEGNVDGPVAPFLHHLLDRAGPVVDQIFCHCVDYPADGDRSPQAVLDYLLAHDLGANTFYVARPGWDVDEVRREHHLRERISELCDEVEGTGDTSAVAMHRWIGDRIRQDPELRWAAEPVPVPFLVRNGARLTALLAAPLGAGLLAAALAALSRRASRRRRGARVVMGLLGAVVAAVGFGIRSAERADVRRDRARNPDWRTVYAEWSDLLEEIRHREDRLLQNHMISVTRIKPGWFRLTTLRVVLWVINAVARLVQNQGSLGGISTIHYARWVITEDRTRLIFLSNFDGSWDRYLTAFIDRASYGLSAVWSNTDNEVGFPDTRWLVIGGAREEVRFKSYARYSMTPTQVWYSAYPTLSVRNIEDNLQLRKGLFARLDEVEARAWLRRL